LRLASPSWVIFASIRAIKSSFMGMK
jgi:hypothetical protein